MSLLEGFLNLLFPPKCPFCGKVQDHAGICPACEKALPWTDALHTIKEGPGGLRCAAPLWYEDQVREGILRLKFQGASGAAEPMGELIARCAAEPQAKPNVQRETLWETAVFTRRPAPPRHG